MEEEIKNQNTAPENNENLEADMEAQAKEFLKDMDIEWPMGTGKDEKSGGNAEEKNEEKNLDGHGKHERKRDRHHRHERQNSEAEEKLQAMGEKLAELNDKYIRSVAEFENYRRRTQKEKTELILNGGKDVIKIILPIVDDMERALASIPDDNAAREGVQLIYNKLMSTLRGKGLKPMEAKGERFDENLHEAVTQVPAADESQKGTVIDVVEKGYYLNDNVLRYAKVVVAI